MDETIIKNWNSKISNNDTAYILGDWIFSRDINKCIETAKKFKGKKYQFLGTMTTLKFVKNFL
jgi:calcineurin-like phosphoesterase family protein